MFHTLVEWRIPEKLNRGPFGSGAWFKSNQEFLQQLLNTHSVHRDEFQGMVLELGKTLLLGIHSALED